MSSHGKRIVFTDKGLPRKRLCAVKQHRKIGCGKRADLDQHALCGTETDICARTIDRLTFKGNTTIHRFELSKPERLDFISEIFFKSK